VGKRKIPALVLLFTTLVLASDKGFNPPPAAHASTYPAHESHDDEKVSIAIDPYDVPEKAAIFRVKYQAHGFLPVRVMVSNDSDKMLMLNDLIVEYITAKRNKLEPATTDDVYRRLSHLKRERSGPKIPLPIPIPRDRSPVSKEVRDAMEELSAAQFLTVPVSPHTTSSGFLFFDIDEIEVPEAGAHVYFSGMKLGGKQLFYFDIPLEDYLNKQPAK
jgi:hypothetical protein